MKNQQRNSETTGTASKYLAQITAIVTDKNSQNRTQALNTLEDYVKNKVPWAKAQQNNEAKYDALNAINALKSGENLTVNTGELRQALNVLKAADMAIMTVKVFTAQARLYADKLGQDHSVSQAMLGFAQGMDQFMDIVQHGSIGDMVKAMIPTYKSFSTHLAAIDTTEGTWTPALSSNDQNSIDLAYDFLKFLVMISSEIQQLPLKEKLSNPITGFIYTKIAKELNFGGHDKPYNKANLFANSMIDNCRQRLKITANVDFDMRFINAPHAAMNHALDFIEQHQNQLTEQEIQTILEPAMRVAKYARYESTFGKTALEEIQNQRNHIDALTAAKAQLKKYSKHPLLNARKIKNVLKDVKALDPKIAQQMRSQLKQMTKPGFTQKRKSKRTRARQQTHELLAQELEMNKKELFELIQSIETPEQNKSWFRRLVSWLWKGIKKYLGVLVGLIYKPKVDRPTAKGEAHNEETKSEPKNVSANLPKHFATHNQKPEQKTTSRWVKKPAANKPVKRTFFRRKTHHAISSNKQSVREQKISTLHSTRTL